MYPWRRLVPRRVTSLGDARGPKNQRRQPPSAILLPPLPPAWAAVAAGPCLKGGGAPVRRPGGGGGTRGGGLGHGHEGALASMTVSGGAPLRLCGQRRGRRLMVVLLACGGFSCILTLSLDEIWQPRIRHGRPDRGHNSRLFCPCAMVGAPKTRHLAAASLMASCRWARP